MSSKCKTPRCKEKIGRYSYDGICRKCRSKAMRMANGLPKKKQEKKIRMKKCDGCEEQISTRKHSGLCSKCLKARQKERNEAKKTKCINPSCEAMVHPGSESGLCRTCWYSIHLPKMKYEFGRTVQYLMSTSEYRRADQ